MLARGIRRLPDPDACDVNERNPDDHPDGVLDGEVADGIDLHGRRKVADAIFVIGLRRYRG